MGGWVTQIPNTHTLVSTLPGPGLIPVYGSSYSNDYGATWNLIDSGINAQHTEAHFLNAFHGWTGRAQSADPEGGTYKWKLHISLDNNAISATDNREDIISDTKNNLSNHLYGYILILRKMLVTIHGLSLS